MVIPEPEVQVEPATAQRLEVIVQRWEQFTGKKAERAH